MAVQSLSAYNMDGEFRYPPTGSASGAQLTTATPDFFPGTKAYRAICGTVTCISGTVTGKFQASRSHRADVEAGNGVYVDDTTRGLVSLTAGQQDGRDFNNARGVRFVPDPANTGVFVFNAYLAY